MDRRSFLAAGTFTGALMAPRSGAATRPALASPEAVLTSMPPGGFDGWSELASFEHEGLTLRVLEDLRRPDGSLAFLTADGRALVLGKHLEAAAGEAGSAPYLGLDLKTVALAGPDLLAERLVASGDDPDEAEVRRAAPRPRPAVASSPKTSGRACRGPSSWEPGSRPTPCR